MQNEILQAIGKLQDQIGSVQHRIESVQHQMEFMHNKIDVVQKQMITMQDQVDCVSKQGRATHNAVGEVQKQLGALDQRLNSRMDQIDSRITGEAAGLREWMESRFGVMMEDFEHKVQHAAEGYDGVAEELRKEMNPQHEKHAERLDLHQHTLENYHVRLQRVETTRS